MPAVALVRGIPLSDRSRRHLFRRAASDATTAASAATRQDDCCRREHPRRCRLAVFGIFARRHAISLQPCARGCWRSAGNRHIQIPSSPPSPPTPPHGTFFTTRLLNAALRDPPRPLTCLPLNKKWFRHCQPLGRPHPHSTLVQRVETWRWLRARAPGRARPHPPRPRCHVQRRLSHRMTSS